MQSPSSPDERPARLRAHALGAMIIAGGVALGVAATRPPEVPDAAGGRATAGTFDTARALEHVRRIADAPRPVGSARHREVAESIRRSVAASGLIAEVQEAWGVAPARYIPAAALVRNIVVRVPGLEGRHAVLVTAHYDSVPTGPGAADNAAGVAAMLDVLRVVAGEPRPRNDLVFLFTDAEEVGLLGARAFRDHHPLDDKVRVVLNFEARGSRGPSILFETGPGNRWVVEQFERAVPHPVGTSLADFVYRVMPNDTDFSVLGEGRTGLNLAFIEGFLDYHTVQDELGELDPASLHHHGAAMLALVRRLGDADLDPTARPAGDAVFFNVVGRHMVSYSAGAAIPFAIVSAIGLAFVIVRARRRGTIRPGRLWRGAVGSLAGALGGATLAQAIWIALARLVPGLELPQEDAYERAFFLAGLVGAVLAFASLVAAWAGRRASAAELLAGALLPWALLALASALLAPGASYLFLWPLVFATGALHLMAADVAPRRPALVALLSAALLAPPTLLLAPTAALLSVALTMSVAAVPALLAGIAAGLLLPVLGGGTRRVSLVLGVAAAALLTGGVVRAEFDRANPRPASLVHLEDAAQNKAWQWTPDPEPDAWELERLGPQPVSGPIAEYPGAPAALFGPTAPLGLEPPRIDLLEDRVTQDGSRLLRVRVASRRGAPLVELYPAPAAALRAIEVGGRRFAAKEPELAHDPALQLWNVPASGVELRLWAAPGQPLDLELLDVSFTAPAGAPSAARPADTIPVPFGFGWTDEWHVASELSLGAHPAGSRR